MPAPAGRPLSKLQRAMASSHGVSPGWWVKGQQFSLGVREQQLAAGLKGGGDKSLAGGGDILLAATHRQRFRHLIQMAGTAFTVARHPRLVAHAGGEVTDKQAHGEHHAEGEQILDIRHRQRPARGDKKEIEADDVDHRRQHRRPAAIGPAR